MRVNLCLEQRSLRECVQTIRGYGNWMYRMPCDAAWGTNCAGCEAGCMPDWPHVQFAVEAGVGLRAGLPMQAWACGPHKARPEESKEYRHGQKGVSVWGARGGG